MNKRKKTGMCWHVHHNLLIEWCYDYDERVDAIRQKPANEVETRLRLFRPVEGGLPVKLVWACAALEKAEAALAKAEAALEKAEAVWVKTAAALEKAEAAWAKATVAWGKAYVAWGRAATARGKAYMECLPEVEALHAKECGCKEWNGEKLVFPNRIL